MVLQSLNLPVEAFSDDLKILTRLSFFAFVTLAVISEKAVTHTVVKLTKSSKG